MTAVFGRKKILNLQKLLSIVVNNPSIYKKEAIISTVFLGSQKNMHQSVLELGNHHAVSQLQLAVKQFEDTKCFVQKKVEWQKIWKSKRGSDKQKLEKQQRETTLLMRRHREENKYNRAMEIDSVCEKAWKSLNRCSVSGTPSMLSLRHIRKMLRFCSALHWNSAKTHHTGETTTISLWTATTHAHTQHIHHRVSTENNPTV